MLHPFHNIPNLLRARAKFDEFSINLKGLFRLQNFAVECLLVDIGGDLSYLLFILLGDQSSVIVSRDSLWSSNRVGMVNTVLRSARAVWMGLPFIFLAVFGNIWLALRGDVRLEKGDTVLLLEALVLLMVLLRLADRRSDYDFDVFIVYVRVRWRYWPFLLHWLRYLFFFFLSQSHSRVVFNFLWRTHTSSLSAKVWVVGESPILVIHSLLVLYKMLGEEIRILLCVIWICWHYSGLGRASLLVLANFLPDRSRFFLILHWFAARNSLTYFFFDDYHLLRCWSFSIIHDQVLWLLRIRRFFQFDGHVFLYGCGWPRPWCYRRVLRWLL